MSLYGTKVKIDGIPCGLVLRGSANGQYQAVFEREFASIEEIEAINWTRPTIEGDCILPAGYGFTATDIQYSSATRSYTVRLQVAVQYLGDVTGYQAQVAALESAAAEKDSTISSQASIIEEQAAAIQTLEEAGSAAQLESDLDAAYQEGVDSIG